MKINFTMNIFFNQTGLCLELANVNCETDLSDTWKKVWQIFLVCLNVLCSKKSFFSYTAKNYNWSENFQHTEKNAIHEALGLFFFSSRDLTCFRSLLFSQTIEISDLLASQY